MTGEFQFIKTAKKFVVFKERLCVSGLVGNNDTICRV